MTIFLHSWCGRRGWREARAGRHARALVLVLVLDEGALADYPGAIVLVTHDDVFAARYTTRTMYVQGGAVS